MDHHVCGKTAAVFKAFALNSIREEIHGWMQGGGSVGKLMAACVTFGKLNSSLLVSFLYNLWSFA